MLDFVFRAGRVRRWHTHPKLSESGDYVDGHSARVARIILAVCPDASRALLVSALTHDDGEHVTGDIPRPVKNSHPEIYQHVTRLERAVTQGLWGLHEDLTQREHDLLHFADMLDSVMWADFHGQLTRDEWEDDVGALLDSAHTLVRSSQVIAELDAILGRLT